MMMALPKTFKPLSCHDAIETRLAQNLSREIVRGTGSRPFGHHHHHLNSSPFPRLDALIMEMATWNGRQGWIANWSYLESRHIITYGIGGNNFCHNIGRFHKSNGIYLLADFNVGAIYQKCFDPDCRSLRHFLQRFDVKKMTANGWADDGDGHGVGDGDGDGSSGAKSNCNSNALWANFTIDEQTLLEVSRRFD